MQNSNLRINGLYDRFIPSVNKDAEITYQAKTHKSSPYSEAILNSLTTVNSKKRKRLLQFSLIPNDAKENISENKKPLIETTKKVKRSFIASRLKKLDAPQLPAESFNPISWNKNNQLGVILANDVYVQDLHTKQTSRFYPAPENANPQTPQSLAWNDKGNVLIGFEDGHFELRYFNSKNLIASQSGLNSPINAVKSLHDQYYIGLDNGLFIHYELKQTAAGKIFSETNRYNLHAGPITSIQINKDSGWIAVGCDGKVALLHEKQETRFLEINGRVRALDWCPWDSSLLAAGTTNEELTKDLSIWKVGPYNNRQLVSKNFTTDITGLKWSKNTSEFATVHDTAGECVKVWDYKYDPKLLSASISQKGSFGEGENQVAHLEISPDGQTLFFANGIGGDDTLLERWEVFPPYKKPLDEVSRNSIR